MPVSSEQHRLAIGLGGFAPRLIVKKSVNVLKLGVFSLTKSMVLFLGLLLVLSGDIECNPGPDTRRSDMDTDMSSGSTQAGPAQPSDILVELRNLTMEMITFRVEVSKWREQTDNRISNLENENLDLRNRISNLENKFEQVDNRQRQKNLIFFGVQDTDANESMGECESKLRQFFENDLQLDSIDIEKVYRIGKNIGRRPIIAIFSNLKDRQSVLDVSKTCNNSRYRVKPDVSQSTRLARKTLAPFYADAVKQTAPNRVKIVGDTMFVDNDRFKVDATTRKLFKVPVPTSYSFRVPGES